MVPGQPAAGNLADVYRSQDRLTILAIADVKRHEYLPDVPTLQELGYNVDDASVNFRGYALPKGVDPSIVDKAAKIVPVMFHDPEVVKRMKDSGSPMLIMDRAQVLEMFPPQLIAEIGDVSRFTHREALTAFAGVDPGVDESGQLSLIHI